VPIFPAELLALDSNGNLQAVLETHQAACAALPAREVLRPKQRRAAHHRRYRMIWRRWPITRCADLRPCA